MEKYKKKDMMRTVETLLHANDVIIKTIRSNPQGAAEALAQCQESAIALGTYIDTFGEKYENLVHVLEDYCENIYQINESLSNENVCRKVSKKIRKQLIGLQDNIKYDLPEDKKEVVFLPYKASMWDSLESVWKAADDDPDCDAYVVPIPYFDKNPDGSFREEHYEGDQYPEYVPVTRYDEYDLKARRPDVIYIHNPYDECNHVTSVHPYFYAKNLKNLTDKLVYIPYFVLGEIEPDNQKAIDGMKHFCFTPGTIYADRVVVQSENMRQIYINEYIKAAKEMGLSGEHVDRKFLEKKFLGLGSPKFDKVLNTRKEDLEIPAEWLKVIEKPDGSWKKIVFYNTSVSALLQYEEKILRKMESVFETFKENRDEVALLWRPHPLIQATIESMRPQLWEKYKEIRERYIVESWGIYDDSPDVERAVEISDIYYGDASSVIQLFQQVEKQIVMLDYDVEYVLRDIKRNVMKDKNIFVTKSSMPPYEEYIKAIRPLWDSHWLTNMGIFHQEFEKKLKEYLKVPELSLFVNGHMALEMSIQAFGFPEGSEVITTPFTFISTTHAIVRNHCKPVFCDVKLSDGTIDETKIEDLITEKTVAIIPVHVYGHVCNVEKIQKIAYKYNLKVIYDAAHAFGVEYKGKGIGCYGDASVFSFHATKVFNTIEGGAVTFADSILYEKLYNLKNFGIRNEELVTEVGANAKMNEFCAIMGLCNLQHINLAMEKRGRRYERYKAGLAQIKGIELLGRDEMTNNNYAYCPILIGDEYKMTRDELYMKLQENHIFTRKYFYPLASDAACFKNKYKDVALDHARDMSERILVLPMYEELEYELIDKILEIMEI